MRRTHIFMFKQIHHALVNEHQGKELQDGKCGDDSGMIRKRVKACSVLISEGRTFLSQQNVCKNS